MNRAHLSRQERDCRSRLAKLVHDAPLLHGTLSVRYVTCGKPTCQCACGKRHKALVLVCRLEGQLEQIYIPKSLEPAVREWVANDRSVRELLQKISAACVERLKEAKRRT